LVCLILSPGAASVIQSAGTVQEDSGSDGMVSIEAEDFEENTPRGSHE
jgi:hypothetical protein